MMNPADCLGLVLAWSRTRGSLMVLQLLFGMTMSLVAKYLQFARRILVKILKHNNLAKMKLPLHEKLEEYRAIFAARHPALDMVWGTMDGLKCRLRKLPTTLFNLGFIMIESQIILSLLYCVLFQMAPLQQVSTMYLDVVTTALKGCMRKLD